MSTVLCCVAARRVVQYHLHGQRFTLLLGEGKHDHGIVVLVHDELDDFENVGLS